MKKILLTALAVSLIALGCSKEEDELPAANAVSGSVSIDSAAPQSANVTAILAANPALDASNLGPPPPATVVDFSTTTEDWPRNANGKKLTDLEYLNQLLEDYTTSRFNFVPNPESAPYKNDEEREAYEASFAEMRKKLRAPISDINQLVKAGVIKAIPPAPVGQKYVINPTSQKVELVAQ